MDASSIPYLCGIMTTVVLVVFLFYEVPIEFALVIVGMIFSIGIVVMLILRMNPKSPQHSLESGSGKQ